MLELQLESWEEMYGVDKGTMTYSGRFITIIRRAYEQTGRRVVVLVDEYDKPMLQTFDKPDLQEDFRKTLTAFYTVLKDADPLSSVCLYHRSNEVCADGHFQHA